MITAPALDGNNGAIYRRAAAPPRSPQVTRAHGAVVFLSGQTPFKGGPAIPLHIHNCPENVVILESRRRAQPPA
jgi:hypothetical protein